MPDDRDLVQLGLDRQVDPGRGQQPGRPDPAREHDRAGVERAGVSAHARHPVAVGDQGASGGVRPVAGAAVTRRGQQVAGHDRPVAVAAVRLPRGALDVVRAQAGRQPRQLGTVDDLGVRPSLTLHGDIRPEQPLLGRLDDPHEARPAHAGGPPGQLGPGVEHRVAAHRQIDLAGKRVVHPDQGRGPARHPRGDARPVQHGHRSRAEPAEVKGGRRADHAGPDDQHVAAGPAGRRRPGRRRPGHRVPRRCRRCRRRSASTWCAAL